MALRVRRLHTPSVFAKSEPRWRASITFEPVPSDFAILKIHTLPENGGDTLWSSSYEAYDRLSPSFAKFLEGLTALHDARIFQNSAAAYILSSASIALTLLICDSYC